MFSKLLHFLFKKTVAEKKLALKDILLTDENENIQRAIKLLKNSKNHSALTIIDVGAFDGETAILFSKAFPNANIMAFEADPLSFKTAKTKTQNQSNIQLHNYALSDRNEKASFYITSNKVSSSLNKINPSEVNILDYQNELNITQTLELETRQLDEFTKDKKIDLLKIDTQGHELKVLGGAKETLKNTRFILIEMSNHDMYTKGCHYYDIDEWMRNNGFKLADLIVTFRQKGIKVSEFDAIYENTAFSNNKMP